MLRSCYCKSIFRGDFLVKYNWNKNYLNLKGYIQTSKTNVLVFINIHYHTPNKVWGNEINHLLPHTVVVGPRDTTTPCDKSNSTALPLNAKRLFIWKWNIYKIEESIFENIPGLHSILVLTPSMSNITVNPSTRFPSYMKTNSNFIIHSKDYIIFVLIFRHENINENILSMNSYLLWYTKCIYLFGLVFPVH